MKKFFEKYIYILGICLNMSLFYLNCHASVTFVLACVLFDFDKISLVTLYIHKRVFTSY